MRAHRANKSLSRSSSKFKRSDLKSILNRRLSTPTKINFTGLTLTNKIMNKHINAAHTGKSVDLAQNKNSQTCKQHKTIFSLKKFNKEKKMASYTQKSKIKQRARDVRTAMLQLSKDEFEVQPSYSSLFRQNH
uniref:Uncharacterized protein n=1 Tax=Euplotes harpa TaxID=151035 RepID=A0A7S3N8P4_9SPIT|mmetsp:Transcript_34253/g.39568  ORF Transcript_34253/g.39568 Transcript_34253/m.39568 type:complete len:133 (+) Transcript_34253:532-930(+)